MVRLQVDVKETIKKIQDWPLQDKINFVDYYDISTVDHGEISINSAVKVFLLNKSNSQNLVDSIYTKRISIEDLKRQEAISNTKKIGQHSPLKNEILIQNFPTNFSDNQYSEFITKISIRNM